MSNNFHKVDYSQFRHALQLSGGQKVKSKGLDTYLYDQKNRMLAVLKAGSIDMHGHTQPAQYFVRNAA